MAHVTAERNHDIVHGICRMCSRRRYLFLPGRWCDKCIEELMAAAAAQSKAAVTASGNEDGPQW